MRIQHAHRANDEGGTLIVALMTCVILGVLIGSYLSLIQNQQLSVTRAAAWNTALVVAEAGIEEAMAHLNSGVTTNNLAVNSWVSVGGGVYEKTNFLGDNYSVVDIKIQPAVTNPYPVVAATAYVPGPISRPKISRTLQVATKAKTIAGGPPAGMVSTSTIDLKGNGITVDSFDSSNTNYSTGGLYDPKKVHDMAAITTQSAAINAISVGNGNVKGIVHTAPGGTISVGSNGSVGDSAWVDGGKSGIEPGHFFDDANFIVPDVTLPSVPSWVAPVAGNYKINGVTYKYVLNNAANWKLSTLDGSVYVNGANVVLYVSDSVNLANKGDQVHIASGASVSFYVGAPSVVMKGSGVINDGGLAKNFTYYGLPSNTAFTLGANAAFTGSIYAPEAAFTLGGGGNNTYDYAGACVVKSVTMNGHFNFHYDENLTATPGLPGYVVISWDEL